MREIDEYVEAVLRHIPPCLPARERIAVDLESHLRDRVSAGESVAEATNRMGDPEEVAREFLAGVELRPAPFGRRIAAFLLDIGLGLLVLLALFGVLVAAGTLPIGRWLTVFGPGLIFFIGAQIALVVFLMGLLYFPALEALRGQTLGKQAFGLCVVRENGERVGWGPAFVRRIPFYFEFFFLDALVALFTQRRQRAFDLVAKTLVVRLDSGEQTQKKAEA